MKKQEHQNHANVNQVLNILHIADPTLPIGGFSHSNGLETYVQQRIVNDANTTKQFVTSMLKYNYKYNDSLLVRFAHQYTEENNMEALIELDAECNALKAPMEVRDGSNKLGIRLLKIYTQLIENPMITEFYKKVIQKECYGHFPIVYGMVTKLVNIEREDAVSSFYYNAAVSMVTNAVKLVPLGQIDGQRILYAMHEIINELTEETIQLNKKMIGVCNPALDIKCMQHERLYSRLYMS